MLWTFHGFLSLHRDNVTDFSSFTLERDAPIMLSQRLASSGSIGTGVTRCDLFSPEVMHPAGSHGELGELEHPYFSGENFLGSGDSLYSFEGFFDKDTGRQAPVPFSSVSGRQMTHSETVAGSAGQYGFTCPS